VKLDLCDLSFSERRYYIAKIEQTARNMKQSNDKETHVLLSQLLDVRKQSTKRSVLRQNCLITSSGLQFVKGDRFFPVLVTSRRHLHTIILLTVLLNSVFLSDSVTCEPPLNLCTHDS
jgi:hypothetical protein